jgi:hypothetical protein
MVSDASGGFPDATRIDAAAGMLVLLRSRVVRFAVGQSANSGHAPSHLIGTSLSTFREVIHTLP